MLNNFIHKPESPPLSPTTNFISNLNSNNSSIKSSRVSFDISIPIFDKIENELESWTREVLSNIADTDDNNLNMVLNVFHEDKITNLTLLKNAPCYESNALVKYGIKSEISGAISIVHSLFIHFSCFVSPNSSGKSNPIGSPFPEFKCNNNVIQNIDSLDFGSFSNTTRQLYTGDYINADNEIKKVVIKCERDHGDLNNELLILKYLRDKSTIAPTGCISLYGNYENNPKYLILERFGTNICDLLTPSSTTTYQLATAVVNALHNLHYLYVMLGD